MWISERVPAGVPFTGVLASANASRYAGLFGLLLGVLTYLTLAPLLMQLLALGYWAAQGRPGTFAATFESLRTYQVPFGMASSQLAISSMILVSLALMVVVHHVDPRYVFSVVPGLRWRPLVLFVAVSVAVFGLLLVGERLVTGEAWVWTPQPELPAFMVAILLTAPLQAAAEEIFFRGYVLQALGSLSTSRWVGIGGSALVFALFHGVQNPWLFASRFAFGVVAAWLVVELGGLEAPMGAHIVNNVMAFTLAGLTVGIPQLKAVTEISGVSAVGEVVRYAAFALVAWLIGRRLRLRRRTGSV